LASEEWRAAKAGLVSKTTPANAATIVFMLVSLGRTTEKEINRAPERSVGLFPASQGTRAVCGNRQPVLVFLLI
jgi:hypothetical protein